MGKHALVIGNSNYKDSNLSTLVSPEVDIEALRSVLNDKSIGNFDSVLTISNGSLSSVQREIARFFINRTSSDSLLLYFSGHGVLDRRGRLFFAVADTDVDILSGTGLSASFLNDEMEHCFASQKVIILDCCHSGAFGGAKNSIGSSVGTKSNFQSSGSVVITASDELQIALDGIASKGEITPSIFTKYLIGGLETGNADLNGDGHVSLDELYKYTFEKVISDSRTSQTPIKIGKQKGEFIIAQNPFITSNASNPKLNRSLALLQEVYDDWLLFEKEDHRLLKIEEINLVINFVSLPTLPKQLLSFLVKSVAYRGEFSEKTIIQLKIWLRKNHDTENEKIFTSILASSNTQIQRGCLNLMDSLKIDSVQLPLKSFLMANPKSNLARQAIYILASTGNTLDADSARYLFNNSTDWITKSISLKNEPSPSALVIRDGSDFSAELKLLTQEAGYLVVDVPNPYETEQLFDFVFKVGGRSFLTLFSLIILVRGEHYSSISGHKLFDNIKTYVNQGGTLLATSWLSWETLQNNVLKPILPFSHIGIDSIFSPTYIEDVIIECKPSEYNLAKEWFPNSMKFRSSFETLKSKSDSIIFLESSDSTPILGMKKYGDGECYYLNSCQHSCRGKMPSPFESSPEFFSGFRRFFKWLYSQSSHNAA